MTPFSKEKTSEKNATVKDDDASWSSSWSAGVVPNFRPAMGLSHIYRCGTPDRLADLILQLLEKKHEDEALENDSDNNINPQQVVVLTKAERLILYDATLIVDLRRQVEVDQTKRQVFLQKAPGGPFSDMKEGGHRQILSFDVIEAAMYNAAISAQSNEDVSIDTIKKQMMKELFQAMNARGMIASFEFILEAAKNELCQCLQAITRHLEDEEMNHHRHQRNNKKTVVIHCAQGKDRTGLVIMLLQSAVGVPENDIVTDFEKSSSSTFSEAAEQAAIKMGIDPVILTSADPDIMKDCLAFIRDKHGSVPMYLDTIGFDDSWRQRLLKAQEVTQL